VTLDYANREIYLEKDPNYKVARKETFTISQSDPRKRGRTSGLGLIRLGHQSVGPLEILEMTAAGTPSRAGIEKGDWILEINGSPVGNLTVEQLFGPTTARPGTVVRLTMRHDDVTREVTLRTE